MRFVNKLQCSTVNGKYAHWACIHIYICNWDRVSFLLPTIAKPFAVMKNALILYNLQFAPLYRHQMVITGLCHTLYSILPSVIITDKQLVVLYFVHDYSVSYLMLMVGYCVLYSGPVCRWMSALWSACVIHSWAKRIRLDVAVLGMPCMSL